MVETPTLEARAEAVLAGYRAHSLKIATAESCTGGLLAGLLTDIPGSSDVFERGFVTYSNDAKAEMLGIPASLIASHGAVSRETALAMATGALANSRTDVAIAITGIAGPGGGSDGKPVGLVHFALARRGHAAHHEERRFGENLSRKNIRREAVKQALSMIEQALRQI